jgi:hypothetical protein
VFLASKVKVHLRISNALSRALREVGDVLLEWNLLLGSLDPTLRSELVGFGEDTLISVTEVGGLRDGSLRLTLVTVRI